MVKNSVLWEHNELFHTVPLSENGHMPVMVKMAVQMRRVLSLPVLLLRAH